eukprot:GHVO01043679.1.p1 GENE.GHVO01043679.1~~GHVO01043679.1.p1  ORF type:complete len:133 (-),score=0.42 GHVO01043679.1:249-647(-)
MTTYFLGRTNTGAKRGGGRGGVLNHRAQKKKRSLAEKRICKMICSPVQTQNTAYEFGSKDIFFVKNLTTKTEPIIQKRFHTTSKHNYTYLQWRSIVIFSEGRKKIITKFILDGVFIYLFYKLSESEQARLLL